jgi:hypothetical protein
MNVSNDINNTINSVKWTPTGPQSALEKKLIKEYLLEKGYRLKDLRGLPKAEAVSLMKEACLYASLKLAEVESRAQFREEIRGPSSS